VLDLLADPDPEEAATWIQGSTIRTLNVAGPRGSASASVYDEACKFLRALLGC
jgi:hypothetical protein